MGCEVDFALRLFPALEAVSSIKSRLGRNGGAGACTLRRFPFQASKLLGAELGDRPEQELATRSVTAKKRQAERLSSPAPPPLVPVARGRWNRLIRLLRPLGDELARVTILDFDEAFESAVLAELDPPGARHLIELPRPFPHERHAGLGGLAVDVGQEAVHSQPVILPRQREQGGAQDVETVVHPLRCLGDSPPALVLGRNGLVHASLRFGRRGSIRLAGKDDLKGK